MSDSKIAALEMMAAELTAKISELNSRVLLGNAGYPLMYNATAYTCGASATEYNPNPLGYDYYLGSCSDPLANAGGSSGDTGFMILSTAIVLMMTIPGLGLYYAGMVKVTNVLSTVMQSFSITCLVTFLYLCLGYSLAFGPPNPLDGGHSSLYYGDDSRFWFWGISPTSFHYLAPTIPESVYCIYQLTFAIITAALICGSFADRMKYGSMMVFIGLWHLGVYCPIAHSNWHPDGFLHQMGVMDFAGGNVVHISSGMAGLMSTIVVGNRHGFGKERFEPHNILLTFIGTSLLWVGWYGFNAGSAGSANAQAGYAMLNTQIATSMAALSWMFTEWAIKKKPSVLGMLSGAVAGLVAITPACGWVDQTGAFFIGLFAGPWCYAGAQIKHYAGYDDALDAFGVHATGGILGGIMTGFFANPGFFSPFVYTLGAPIPYEAGVFYDYGNPDHQATSQLRTQVIAICCTVCYSTCASFVLLKLVDLTMGLRVSAADELEGLDVSLHGETILAKEDNPVYEDAEK